VQELARASAVDFEQFYGQRERSAADDGDALVLSCDGKGVVMRADALRPETKKHADASETKLKTRLSRGEKRNRKRIAEVTAVDEVKPKVRTPADILPPTDGERELAQTGPGANNKWVSATVTDDAATAIARMFEEAQRRDPAHQRAWVALVDRTNHQINQINKEARNRKLKTTILVDCGHVLEYLWRAAWSFFNEGDPAAERWVRDKARARPQRTGRHSRRRDPPQGHHARSRRRQARGRRPLRQLPTGQTPLPRLPHRPDPCLRLFPESGRVLRRRFRGWSSGLVVAYGLV